MQNKYFREFINTHTYVFDEWPGKILGLVICIYSRFHSSVSDSTLAFFWWPAIHLSMKKICKSDESIRRWWDGKSKRGNNHIYQ